MPDYFLALDPGTVELPLKSEATQDPVYGLPAIWVHKKDKEDAVFRGYTVVNCATVIATHITKVLKEHAGELITRQEVHQLVERLKDTNPKVVDEVLSQERLSLGDVLRVMQNLLFEDVSVRDILSLFECLADHCKMVKNPDVLSEFCRKAVGRHIVQKLLDEHEDLKVVTFDRFIEDILAGGLVSLENGSSYLNLDAKQAQDILQKLIGKLKAFDEYGTQPVLLISAKLRKPFHTLVSKYVRHLSVLSYDELPYDIRVKNLGMIS
jgi:flagellar biosynthesis protein FlhA